MPKRESTDIKGRVPLSISVTREEKRLIEEEASKGRQTVSAFMISATMALIGAPRINGVPMLPSSGYTALPVSVDEHIFVPRNWGPEELRRAARFYEGLQNAVEPEKPRSKR